MLKLPRLFLQALCEQATGHRFVPMFPNAGAFHWRVEKWLSKYKRCRWCGAKRMAR